MEGQLLTEKVGSVEARLRKLWKAYEIQPNVRQGSTKGSSLNVRDGKLCDDMEDSLAGFDTFQSNYKKPEAQKSQLDQYLDEPKLDINQKIDILQYWKENQVRYPQLAIMARDILSIPITTVASESTFSIGGRIISKYRSSLCSSNAEALLCTRDWLFDLKDEDEVDEKELIDEDIEKLIKSSSKDLVHQPTGPGYDSYRGPGGLPYDRQRGPPVPGYDPRRGSNTDGQRGPDFGRPGYNVHRGTSFESPQGPSGSQEQPMQQANNASFGSMASNTHVGGGFQGAQAQLPPPPPADGNHRGRR